MRATLQLNTAQGSMLECSLAWARGDTQGLAKTDQSILNCSFPVSLSLPKVPIFTSLGRLLLPKVTNSSLKSLNC